MNVICSPWGIAFLPHPKQGIMDIANAGFKNTLLEFGMWCHAGDLEYPEKSEKNRKENSWKVILENPAALETEMRLYMDCLHANGLSTPVAHASGMLLKRHKMHLYEPFVSLVKEHVRLCGKYGCKYIIVPQISIKDERGSMWELNKAYYMELVSIAKEQKVQILLTNQCKSVDGHVVRGICSSAQEAALWVDELNREAAALLQEEKAEVFGFCFNVGEANLCGLNMYEFILHMGDRLKAVMLNENDGHRGASLLPFTSAIAGQSNIDWLSLIRGLRETGFDGELIFNFCDSAVAMSPLLRPQFMTLAKSVAEYFKWQIEIENLLKKHKKIVLFGAGNMCRNYMKCYGEKYPPLFTCDNNAAVWGNEFCGLEIKSPECLKDLPEDCAIFICNIYYREISEQLREMGVKNPIEFFNDEYMPTFYFDRI